MLPAPLPSLDHLILFLSSTPFPPYTPLIPSSLARNFTLTPGGTHADNLTTNTLILLQDGCYIELITFVPDAPQEKIDAHWWGHGKKTRGWVDWCLTSSSPSPLPPSSEQDKHQSAATTFYKTAGLHTSHTPPLAGARTRPDGVRVEWEVTFPQGEKGGRDVRGKIPFFCHDITDRGVRVPISDEATKHECGALGVRQITVLVAGEEAREEVVGIYTKLFGKGRTVGEEILFEVGRVRGVEEWGGAEVVVRGSRTQEERERVGERGYWVGDIVLGAKADSGKEKGARDRVDEAEGVGGLWIEYV